MSWVCICASSQSGEMRGGNNFTSQSIEPRAVASGRGCGEGDGGWCYCLFPKIERHLRQRASGGRPAGGNGGLCSRCLFPTASLGIIDQRQYCTKALRETIKYPDSASTGHGRRHQTKAYRLRCLALASRLSLSLKLSLSLTLIVLSPTIAIENPRWPSIVEEFPVDGSVAEKAAGRSSISAMSPST